MVVEPGGAGGCARRVWTSFQPMKKALAMTISAAADGAEADDRLIREKLLAELKAQKWAEVSPANVTVKDGVVHLWSSYLSEQEKRALIVAAENIPGVRRVEEHVVTVPAISSG